MHWCVVALLEMYSPCESGGGLCDARRDCRQGGGRRRWLVPKLGYKSQEPGLGRYHANESVATVEYGRA